MSAIRDLAAALDHLNQASGYSAVHSGSETNLAELEAAANAALAAAISELPNR